MSQPDDLGQPHDLGQHGARQELLGWLSEPSTRRGIRFATEDGSWDWWSYQRLATLTRQVGAGMAARGLGPGAAAAIVQRSGPQFVASLFGAMLAGGAAAPIAPPMRFTDPGQYREYLAGLLAGCQPHLIVTEPELAGPLRDLAGPAAAQVVTPAELAAAAAPGLAAGPASGVAAAPGETVAAGPRAGVPGPGGDAAGLVLLQFTSGSSGVARTVRVPATALLANVTAIRRWLRWTSADPVASWLPVHHDMGLIGCLITPVVSRSDLWLLPAEEFIRRPARYLRCFGESGARLTAMPTFGLEHITRHVRPADLAGLDFSAWRAAIIGAEHLEGAVLDRFCALLAPHGFRRLALLPAYGLAETTLAATGVPLDEQWRPITVDPATLVPGQPVGLRPAARPAPNGPAPNGAVLNGAVLNGPAPNGPAPNGPAPNGPAPNGPGPTGLGPNGPGPTGAVLNGAAPNGAGPNGAGRNGAALKGAAPGRTAYGRAAGNGAVHDDAGVALVGCGRPLHGMSVRIVDAAGAELPEGWLGEIELCGPSVAAGYAGQPATSASQFLDGRLRTGDAGFLTGGQLVVLGRFGDSLKIRGRSVFAEDVEAAVARAGVPGRRVAAALGVHQGRPTAVVVLEDQDIGPRARAEAAARRCTEHADLVIVPAPRGTIPRTTSGKVRRRLIWAAYTAGATPLPADT